MDKTTIPLFLSVVALVLGAGSMYLAVTHDDGTSPAPTPEPDPTVLSWDVGTVTVSLDLETGVCTVSGSGAMPSSAPLGYWPWLQEHRLDIKKVVIDENVTYIGEGAFRECRCMVELTIAESLTSIGFRAFWGCSSLPSLDIPRSVDILLADGSFGCCVNLAHITGTWHTAKITDDPFTGCPHINS